MTCYCLSVFQPCWREVVPEATTVCRLGWIARHLQSGGKSYHLIWQTSLDVYTPSVKGLARFVLFFILFLAHCAHASSQNVELHLCRNDKSIEGKIDHCTNVINDGNYSSSNWAFVTAHNTRGLAYMASGRYEDAIADFDFVISHGPQLAGYYDNRQNAYRQSSMFDRALADADKAIQLAPDQSFVYRGRATVYKDMGKYDLAVRDYSRGIELAPEDGGLFIDRGKIFRSQSRFDQAIRDFSRALEIDATRWSYGYRERGLTYALIGAREPALDDLTTYNALSPGDQEVISALQSLGAR